MTKPREEQIPDLELDLAWAWISMELERGDILYLAQLEAYRIDSDEHKTRVEIRWSEGIWYRPPHIVRKLMPCDLIIGLDEYGWPIVESVIYPRGWRS